MPGPGVRAGNETSKVSALTSLREREREREKCTSGEDRFSKTVLFCRSSSGNVPWEPPETTSELASFDLWLPQTSTYDGDFRLIDTIPSQVWLSLAVKEVASQRIFNTAFYSKLEL